MARFRSTGIWVACCAITQWAIQYAEADNSKMRAPLAASLITARNNAQTAARTDGTVALGFDDGSVDILHGLPGPSPGGFYVLTVIAIRGRGAMVFAFEDSSGVKAAEHADLAAFTEYLASIRF